MTDYDGSLMLAAADKFEPKLAKAIYRTLRQNRDQVSEEQVVALLQAGQWDAAIDLVVNGLAVLKAEPQPQSLEAVYLRLLQEGGRVAQKLLAEMGLTTGFRMTLPEWERYAQSRAASLVRGLRSDTRQTLRNLLAAAMRGEGTSASLARTIRSMVGLTPQQAQAVANFEFAAREAAAANAPVRWMQNQWTASPQWSGKSTAVDSATRRYADRLLAQRAETIARTETMTTLHQGQLDQWRQMVQDGLMEHTKVERHWLVTLDDRLCDLCAPMAGEVIPLEERWVSTARGFEGHEVVISNGPIVDTPPLHPRCRCTEYLVYTGDLVGVGSTPEPVVEDLAQLAS